MALPKGWEAQLATLVKEPPDGPGWVHEVKYDGYRIAAFLEQGAVRLLSRNDNDWTARFPEIARAVGALPAREALLDGEVVVFLPDGRTSFQALQNAANAPRPRPDLAYVAFDLLALDGEDLRPLPLSERKPRLAALLADADPRIRSSSHVEAPGAEVLRSACALGAEGIVSKRLDAPYRGGRGRTWLKTKCVLRQELVIGGFTDPSGKREGIGALLVGVREDGGGLRFAGKVGTGFTQASARELRARLEPLEQEDCPFARPPAGGLGRNVHWVRPELVAEVAFSEWTEGGLARHPSFQGLREDKPAAEVVRERPASDPRVAGVGIRHPDRLVFPDVGLTKLDLALYAEAIGPRMLPHVRGRPLTLLRCPGPIGPDCAFMEHSKVWAPEPLRRVRIPERTKLGEYLVADTVEALVALVQMDVVEVHTWNSRVGRLERPDRIVLDLDPGPEVPWARVVEGARTIRRMLDVLGLGCFVKTTGGTGLHVVVPIVPERPGSECLAFARALAEALERQAPETWTTRYAKRGREGKILLDYLRNNRTNTSVAAFSIRARPGAPVSVPIGWDELSDALRSDAWDVRTVLRRTSDPWTDEPVEQRIPDQAIAALSALAR